MSPAHSTPAPDDSTTPLARSPPQVLNSSYNQKMFEHYFGPSSLFIPKPISSFGDTAITQPSLHSEDNKNFNIKDFPDYPSSGTLKELQYSTPDSTGNGSTLPSLTCHSSTWFKHVTAYITADSDVVSSDSNSDNDLHPESLLRSPKQQAEPGPAPQEKHQAPRGWCREEWHQQAWMKLPLCDVTNKWPKSENDVEIFIVAPNFQIHRGRNPVTYGY